MLAILLLHPLLFLETDMLLFSRVKLISICWEPTMYLTLY